jgi:hypothetical protein
MKEKELHSSSFVIFSFSELISGHCQSVHRPQAGGVRQTEGAFHAYLAGVGTRCKTRHIRLRDAGNNVPQDSTSLGNDQAVAGSACHIIPVYSGRGAAQTGWRFNRYAEAENVGPVTASAIGVASAYPPVIGSHPGQGTAIISGQEVWGKLVGDILILCRRGKSRVVVNLNLVIIEGSACGCGREGPDKVGCVAMDQATICRGT